MLKYQILSNVYRHIGLSTSHSRCKLYNTHSPFSDLEQLFWPWFRGLLVHEFLDLVIFIKKGWTGMFFMPPFLVAQSKIAIHGHNTRAWLL